MKVTLSDIFHGGPLWPSYIIGQVTVVCLIQARKCPNNCFKQKRFSWTVPYLTSIILCHIFLQFKDSDGFQN